MNLKTYFVLRSVWIFTRAGFVWLTIAGMGYVLLLFLFRSDIVGTLTAAFGIYWMFKILNLIGEETKALNMLMRTARKFVGVENYPKVKAKDFVEICLSVMAEVENIVKTELDKHDAEDK